MPNPEEFRKKIDAAAQKMGLNEKQIKALYVLNGVESRSGTATENSYANTDASRIRKVFGSGSAIGKLSDSEIDKLKKDDEAFFNKAYGHKLDNEGEGYKYRGRGGVQLTGKSNYKKLTDILNKNGVDIDLVKNPELAADPRYSADILIGFADKEGMFTKGSDKYLSDSDLDKIAQGDPSAIDRLHNVTNSKADNEHITKIAREVYANKDGAYNVSNMTDGGKSPSGGDEVTTETEAFRVAEEERQAKGWAKLDNTQKELLSKGGVNEKTTKEEAADIVKKGGPPNFLDVTDDERKKINDWVNAGMPPAQMPKVKGKTSEEVKDFGKNGPTKGVSGADLNKELLGGSGIADPRSDFTRKKAPELNGESGVDDMGGTTSDEIKIDDLDASDPLGDPKNVTAIDDIDAIRQRIAENEDLLGGLERRPAFDDTYAPDEQGRDVGGYITDAARGIMGVAGATKPLPVYERGEMFQTSMDELTDRRNMGLSADEIGFAKQMAERGYGYDVKNISRMAGGSAGVALGNLGRATGQLYDEYGKLAVRDEGVRRQNRSDFNRGALSDEQVNRQIFEDKYNEDWTSKNAASGLVQDSIENIKERNQYEKSYGKGSQMYEYEKELTLDRRRSRENLDWANQQADSKATSELKSGLFNDRKKLVELENKNSGESFVNGNSGFIPQSSKSGLVEQVNSSSMTREEGLRKLGLNESMLENMDAAGTKQISDKLYEMGVSF